MLFIDVSCKSGLPRTYYMKIKTLLLFSNISVKVCEVLTDSMAKEEG